MKSSFLSRLEKAESVNKPDKKFNVIEDFNPDSDTVKINGKEKSRKKANKLKRKDNPGVYITIHKEGAGENTINHTTDQGAEDGTIHVHKEAEETTEEVH